MKPNLCQGGARGLPWVGRGPADPGASPTGGQCTLPSGFENPARRCVGVAGGVGSSWAVISVYDFIPRVSAVCRAQLSTAQGGRGSRPCPKGTGKLWEAAAWSGVCAGKVSRPLCAEGLMERPRWWGRQSWGDTEAPPCES